MYSKILSHNKLYILVSVFLVISAAYNVIVPLAWGDDEFGHFQYVRFIAEEGHVPRNEIERKQAGYVSIYPPLYYSLLASLLFGVDNTEDTVFKRIRYGQIPQQALIDEVTDINWILPTAIMEYPYQKAVLLWHLSRLISSFLGAGVIVVTYFTALNIFPCCKSRALIAAAILAFIPRFIFTTSAVNNDSLIALIMALYLLLMVKLIKGNQSWWLFISVGVVLGLAIVTKFSVLLVPATMTIFLIFLAWRQKWPLSLFFKRWVVIALCAILISSWWFIFTTVNFGDLKSQGPIIGIYNAIIPQASISVTAPDSDNISGVYDNLQSLPNISDWLVYLFKSFWAVAFSTNKNLFLLSPGLFFWLVPVLIIVGIGLIKAWRHGDEFLRTCFVLFGIHSLSLPPLMFIRYFSKEGGVFETAQGRHILIPTVSAVAILIMIGWVYSTLQPKIKWSRPILPATFVFLSVIQLAIVNHIYPKPLSVAIYDDARPSVEIPIHQIYFDSIELSGYTTQISEDGAYLEVLIAWQSHRPASKDYLTEIRLVDMDREVVSSWLEHPANGYYPTRVWAKDETIYDKAVLPLYNLKPGDYTLEIYLREAYQPFENQVADPLVSTPIILEDIPQQYHHFKTQSIQTDSEDIKINYQLWPFEFFDFGQPTYHHRATISLLWQVETDLKTEQKVEVKLIGPDDRIFESLSLSGNLANFVVGPDWPAGLYYLKAEYYQGDRIIGANSTLIPLLQVNNKDRQFSPPPTSNPIDANFYNYIKLVGYDLPDTRVNPGDELSVFVHWQDLQILNADLIMFNHLYDANNELWASFDHILPPYYGGPITWVPGEIVTDGYTIPIANEVPDGIYTLQVGLFLKVGGSWVAVPLVDNNEQVLDITHVSLGPIKIGSGPPEILVSDPQPEYPRGDNLGGAVSLKGYDIAYTPQNSELGLTLYWQSLATIDGDFIRFVHLQDESGQVVAQMDNPPTNGSYPISLWEVNEVVRDEVILSLPDNLSSNTYNLIVGIYNAQSGERLPIAGSIDNSIVLHEFTID